MADFSLFVKVLLHVYFICVWGVVRVNRHDFRFDANSSPPRLEHYRTLEAEVSFATIG